MRAYGHTGRIPFVSNDYRNYIIDGSRTVKINKDSTTAIFVNGSFQIQYIYNFVWLFHLSSF